jgi:hypothetical protein
MVPMQKNVLTRVRVTFSLDKVPLLLFLLLKILGVA